MLTYQEWRAAFLRGYGNGEHIKNGYYLHYMYKIHCEKYRPYIT